MTYWVRTEFKCEKMREICKVAEFRFVLYDGPYMGPVKDVFRSSIQGECARLLTENEPGSIPGTGAIMRN